MEKTEATLNAGRFVALIRGINVGRANRVAMADLRALAEDLAFSDVTSLLNSGNIVFTGCSSALAAAEAFEQGIASRFDIFVRVTVLTASEVDEVVRNNPLLGTADNPSRLLVAVLVDPEGMNRFEPLLDQEWSPEILALGARVAYLWCPNGVLKSPLHDAFGRMAGEDVSARNWATILKIHAALHGPS